MRSFLSAFLLRHGRLCRGNRVAPVSRPGPAGHLRGGRRPGRVEPHQNLAWQADVPGRGWSSPVLAQGRLYLTSAVGAPGEETTLHAFCFDAADGALVWDTEVFQPGPPPSRRCTARTRPPAPRPSSGGRIYVHFGHMGTAALDLDGKIVWKQNELT